MQKTNIIFLGNTKYSKIGVEIVNSTFPLSAIVTIPDSPVAKWGTEKNIPVITAEKFDQGIINTLSNLNPDFLIVEDYGLILPKEVLELPKYAPLNVHQSLLPKYRGPSPVPTTILSGDSLSGVTIIKMTDEVDAGDILAQSEYKLADNETTDSLLTVLNTLGGKLIVEVIKQYLTGSEKLTPQGENKASYTKKLHKEDGYFNINNPPSPEELDRKIRAYFPWPGVWTKWEKKIVKFLPGNKIQMEGKKAVSLKDFLNGYPNFPKIKLEGTN